MVKGVWLINSSAAPGSRDGEYEKGSDEGQANRARRSVGELEAVDVHTPLRDGSLTQEAEDDPGPLRAHRNLVLPDELGHERVDLCLGPTICDGLTETLLELLEEPLPTLRNVDDRHARLLEAAAVVAGHGTGQRDLDPEVRPLVGEVDHIGVRAHRDRQVIDEGHALDAFELTADALGGRVGIDRAIEPLEMALSGALEQIQDHFFRHGCTSLCLYVSVLGGIQDRKIEEKRGLVNPHYIK